MIVVKSQLCVNGGNQKDILIELENYYKALYQCKEVHTEFDLRIDKTLSDSSIIKLNDRSIHRKRHLKVKLP